MEKSKEEQAEVIRSKDAEIAKLKGDIAKLKGEVARLEKLNRWEQGRRISLEGDVDDLKWKLRRQSRSTVQPW